VRKPTKKHVAKVLLGFSVVGMVISVVVFLAFPKIWVALATLVILLLSFLALVYSAVGDLWIAEKDEES
jgi:hypothetical protein